MARTIARSVGRNGDNREADVRTVQDLLNANLNKVPGIAKLDPDGKVGPRTIAAIEAFQRLVVGMTMPDGRVDPGGRTLALLNQNGGPPVIGATFRIVFAHGGKAPEMAKPAKTTDPLYESSVTVSGPKSGTFRGSIYPDDMAVKGRIKDGTYGVAIGFHKRSGTPTPADLVARTQGFRAAVVVNDDAPVPVISDSKGKTASSSIHIHNGFHTERGSEGCLTLHPSDWPRFIQLFLDAYPNLADWKSRGTYFGKTIGVVVVQS
jgi:peptidoglycan hydrolase-like protein with peptidoglycan-binding domain